jgi:hypothetical protein
MSHSEIRDSFQLDRLRSIGKHLQLIRFFASAHNEPIPGVLLRRESGGYVMFDMWEVIEELGTMADKRGTKRISMSEIGKELKDAEQNNAENIQQVHKGLVELGYQVEV